MDINASLVYFLLNEFQLNPDYYKCPEGFKPERVRREYWGIYFVATGIFQLILYTICFIAIAKSDLLKTPAYKAMLVLGFHDLLSIPVFGLNTGILSFFGFHFCDYPRYSFLMGCAGLWSWMGSCITSLVLAVIRILDVSDSKLGTFLFEGKKIYGFLIFCCSYGLGSALFTMPVIFSIPNMSWLFNPMIGKDPNLYVNLAQTFNNCFVVVATFILYAYLVYYFWVKRAESNEFSRRKFNLLIQSFFFCFFHLSCAICYVYMQYVDAPKLLMIIGHLSWQFGTVSICTVYLTLNRSIRTTVIQMIYPKAKVQVEASTNRAIIHINV